MLRVMATALCRKAEERDLDFLEQLINGYAERSIMLPRTKETLRSQLDTFVIAESEGVPIGCGALTRLGPELAEIRSLGIVDGYKGKGIGTVMVEALVEEARQLRIPRVMALTYEVKFFERNGFTVVQKEIFPEKVWKDCIHCKKQHCCDEIAVLKLIEPA